MADQLQAPPLPPRGSIVSEQALYLSQISLYRNTIAFGGTRNPSAVWAAMTYNEPWTFAYFRELEEKDEDVSNCLDTLKYKVTKRARAILPANDSDSLAAETKEFIEQQFADVDFDEVFDHILDAPGYGFSVQEMEFDVSAGQASLLKIHDCSQDLFLFGNRFRPQIGNLQYLEQPFASEGQEVPESKFLITTYRGRAGNRMGRPLLKEVFWPSWFKRNIERLWMRFAEKGPGTAVVKYNDADNAKEKQLAAEIAQAIMDSVAIGVPKTLDIEMELLKIARSQDPAVYERFFQAMQYSIARRVLGETLTTFGNEGGTGARAQGEVHENTLVVRSISLSRAVESVINRQLIRPLIAWNFGPSAPVPTLSIDTKQDEDMLQRLKIDGGLQRMGKKFTVGDISTRYGVPMAPGEKPDDVLTPNAAAPMLPITDQADDDNDYSERGSRGNGQQAHREMGEFDKLFDQLKADATGVFKERIAEIAREAIPVVRS